MAKAKFMSYDRDEGRFIVLKSNNIVTAIYTAWNYEFPVYERETEECIFDGFADNDDNNEMFKDYDVRVIDREGLRRLQTISTGEVHKAPWDNQGGPSDGCR
ncbi:hypothetical protein EVJ32_09545 [Exiguobacterium sp. SH5S4]|uniref:hypothetical protein n=1 Tax=Exiguobacterium sp. SH5S4 TaxID=2510961 RepID=UPI001040072C|nr:hypothetical protein [Exiguobacterium sp. SH5S4]TCI25558.1 hypothetical protein EVJ32_09545 [Exiguobacterium sp. SH5S4]